MENKTTIVVFGASGDLAKKKTYPALFGLMCHGYLPDAVRIIGYARTEMKLEDFRAKIREKLPQKSDKDKKLAEDFLQKCTYLAGSYDSAPDFEQLKKLILQVESSQQKSNNARDPATRLFYLALPPIMFEPVAQKIKQVLHDASCVNRMIVEKPFGMDLQSSNVLSKQLSSLFKEEEIYRIDHYLGKEMVKNILVLKFANIFVSGIWSRNFINNVQITFKEPFGTEGRGGYFDQYGIIRDVIQNHLLQVLSMVAMERPVSLGSEDIRDEKVKVLKCIRPLSRDHLLIGQYTASKDGKNPGYLQDKTVPEGSLAATYAACVLFIDNERWAGVPFILKAGKALDEKKAEIRIQFDDVPGSIYPNIARNELVIRVQPDEAVYMKMMAKKPGLSNETTISELDLSYSSRYMNTYIPDAYESLILDVLQGNGSNFVRSDELEAAWKIFTPILHLLEREKVKPELYQYGSRGPTGSSDFMKRYGFIRSDKEYVWSPRTQNKL